MAIAILVAAGCGGQETGEAKRGVYTDPGPVKADGTNSCVNNCGGQAPAGCWCDSLCKVFQDCCADYDAECTNPQTCGPWPGGQCAAGDICDIQSCGIGGGGTCVAQPDPSDCVQLMYLPAEPVCGCDGKTYGSNCDRLAAGVALDHKGSCNPTPPPPPTPQKCGPWLNGQCPSGQVCDIQSCGIGAGGVCIVQPDASQCVDLMWQQPQPVCGCDGVTYNNDCLRQAAGAALAHKGAC